MIEALFIGTIISYMQFNAYLKDNFNMYQQKVDKEKENDSKAPTTPYQLSRYTYLMLFVYQYVNGLIMMVILIYGIYLIDYVFALSTNSTQDGSTIKKNEVMELWLSFMPHYKKYFVTKNLFVQETLKHFFIGLIINYAFISLLIMSRGSKTENNRKKIKQDVVVILTMSILTNILLTIFL